LERSPPTPCARRRRSHATGSRRDSSFPRVLCDAIGCRRIALNGSSVERREQDVTGRTTKWLWGSALPELRALLPYLSSSRGTLARDPSECCHSVRHGPAFRRVCAPHEVTPRRAVDGVARTSSLGVPGVLCGCMLGRLVADGGIKVCYWAWLSCRSICGCSPSCWRSNSCPFGSLVLSYVVVSQTYKKIHLHRACRLASVVWEQALGIVRKLVKLSPDTKRLCRLMIDFKCCARARHFGRFSVGLQI